MKKAILAMVVMLLGSAFVVAQEAAPAAPAAGSQLENLFVEGGVGMMMPSGEEKTPLAYGAVNYGLPLADEWGLGGQVGAKYTFRDNDQDYLLGIGAFQRNLTIGPNGGAWALQGIYQHTWLDADFAILKPTFGIDLDRTNYLALTGIWGLNDSKVRQGNVKSTQEPVDQALVFWGTEWDAKIRTELGAGYAFQDVDRFLVAAHAGYAIDNITSINFTGAMDFSGDYYAGLSLGFDLGANGRNATFNNVTKSGANDYTPFPLGSLPVMFYESANPVLIEAGIPEEE